MYLDKLRSLCFLYPLVVLDKKKRGKMKPPPKDSRCLFSLLIRPGPERGEVKGILMFSQECSIFSKTWKYKFCFASLRTLGLGKICSCLPVRDPGKVTPLWGP